MRVFLIEGSWAIQVANEFVHAEVEGLDLAPIQPTNVPPNCRFVGGVDITDGLDPGAYPDGSYDLVQARYLLSCCL